MTDNQTDDKREFWKAKLSALFHDPLGKVLDVKNHEDKAQKIAAKLNIEYSRGPEDPIASSMDRLPLPFENPYKKAGEQIRIAPDEIEIIHPFSSKKLSDDIKSKLNNANADYVDLVSDLIDQNKGTDGIDYEKTYHAVWWNLPYLTDMAQFIPADSRIPNHSIIDHLDTTAALTPCVKGNYVEASLIAVAIGPVQELIAQARKTRDLWAGSYLLSYLIYKAIEKVGLNYGFDAIIYPYLRGIPFVKDTLENRLGVKLGNFCTLPPMSDKVASLPNIFVAVVPTGNVDVILSECKEAVTSSWMEICNDACSEIIRQKDRAGQGLGRVQYVADFNKDSFPHQAEIFPNISAVSYPLLDPKNAVDEVKKFFTGSGAEEYQKVLDDIGKLGGYKPNKGTYYRYSYRILTSKLAAVKKIRRFKPFCDDSSLSGISQADDFGGNVKACTIFMEKDEQGDEKRDMLGALNSVKRVLATVLSKEIRYESTLDVAHKNGSDKNDYIAILLMDGDRMGEWVSGDKAPNLDVFTHSKVRDAFKASRDLNKIWDVISKLKPVQPSYHRGLSRTLSVFSSLVEAVISEYDGMLVYCGGDDVMALLPAVNALECANKIRKLYSGNEKIEIKYGNKTYHTDQEALWTKGKPIAPLMGSSATMSAGIAVAHYKSPLQFAVKLAKEAEKHAKEMLGRNAFAIKLMRRSGQMVTVGSKWGYDDVNDAAQVAVDIIKGMTDLNISHRSIYKLLCPDLPLFEEDIDKLTDYVISRSIQAKEKDKAEELGKLKENLKRFIGAVFRQHKKISSEDVKEMPDIETALKAPIDLLLTLRLMKRGDER